MDGIEVVGTQHHAAASPFLLSSPPPGHHHHHVHHTHASYNIQAVQLSFDACLAYNTASSTSGIPIGRGTSSPIAATSVNSGKAVSLLTLSSCPPLHSASSDSPDIHHRHRHHHHHHHNDSQQHHSISENPVSPSDSAEKQIQPRNGDDDDVCIGNCQDDMRDATEKDKPGDLNTPVTTSSDLPSFFGPSALVEPPPISGTASTLRKTSFKQTIYYNRFSLILNPRAPERLLKGKVKVIKATRRP